VKTITIEVPEDLPTELTDSEGGLPEAFRLAAAIQWYGQGLVSQGKGAEIAGLSRVEFIDALGRAGVSAIQTTVDELRSELESAHDAHR